MIKRVLIFILLTTVALSAQCFNKLIPKDTTKTVFKGFCKDTILFEEYNSKEDTSYFFRTDSLRQSITEYGIFFDNDFKSICESKYLINDSIYVTKYWRNGRRKSLSKSILDDWGFLEIPVYQKSWYSNGQISQDPFNPNASDSIIQKMTQYHENGQVFVQFQIKGVMTIIGPFYSYYDNGNMMEKGSYLDGKKNSIWIHYSELGKKDYEEVYENGILIKTTKSN